MRLAVLFLVFVAAALGYNDVYPVHPGVGAIFKGPNSETIIKGPDGSVITAEQVGGSVATEVKAEAVGVVAEKATIVAAEPVVEVAAKQLVVAEPVIPVQPVVSAGPAVVSGAPTILSASPAIVSAAPAAISAVPSAVQVEPAAIPAAPETVLAESGTVQEAVPAAAVVPQSSPVVIDAIQTVPVVSEPVSFHSNPIIVEDAPVKEVDSAKLDGPSGSISTHGQNSIISGPASTTISDGKVTAEVVPVKPLPVVKTPIVITNQVSNLPPLPIQRLQQSNPPPLVPGLAGIKSGLPAVPLYRQEVIKNYK